MPFFLGNSRFFSMTCPQLVSEPAADKRGREREEEKGVKWGSYPLPFSKSGGEQSAQSDSFNLVFRERAIKHLQEDLLLFPSFSRLIISHLCFA